MKIYSFKIEKMFKVMVHIFYVIVCVNKFDALPKMILNVSLELLECIKIFSFLLKKVDPGVSRKVINKSEQVASLAERQGWTWTHHITMN